MDLIRLSVPSSSIPIRREYPATSAARIAASRRSARSRPLVLIALQHSRERGPYEAIYREVRSSIDSMMSATEAPLRVACLAPQRNGRTAAEIGPSRLAHPASPLRRKRSSIQIREPLGSAWAVVAATRRSRHSQASMWSTPRRVRGACPTADLSCRMSRLRMMSACARKTHGVSGMTDSPDYTPPKVWTWTKPSGGRFANINRPIAGPTHEKDLPVGRHPLQLYSLGTPNGVKVTVMLEELLALGHKGAEYDAWLIQIMRGDQFGSGFVEINPNSKIPALADRTGPEPIRVFESGAILLYLAEEFDAFLPHDPKTRAECLSWLFWQIGSTPYLGGGFGHFYAYAPIKIEYAIDRYA